MMRTPVCLVLLGILAVPSAAQVGSLSTSNHSRVLAPPGRHPVQPVQPLPRSVMPLPMIGRPPLLMGIPTATSNWITPAQLNGIPVWGIKGGIALGAQANTSASKPVLPGPYGLFCLFTPYLGQPFAVDPKTVKLQAHVLNYVAVEPVANGVRSFSEYESLPITLVAGSERITAETMTLRFAVGRYKNGLTVIVEVTMRQDHPHEIGFAVVDIHNPARLTLDQCILTATMGNYSRLRRLHLTTGIATPLDHEHARWSVSEVDPYGFIPDPKKTSNHEGHWYSSHLYAVKLDTAGSFHGVAAQTDEDHPENVPALNRSHWQYTGQKAIQYWIGTGSDLQVAVNGRYQYYGGVSSKAGSLLIPNTRFTNPGPTNDERIAYENFELNAAFKLGQVFYYGAIPDPLATTPNTYDKLLLSQLIPTR